MKALTNRLTAAILSAAILLASSVDIYPRGRNTNNERRPSDKESPVRRPGNSGQAPGHRPGNQRPDQRPNQRPGNHRPDQRPNQRPGQHPGNHRPDQRPNHRPDHRPGHRPGHPAPPRPPRPPYGHVPHHRPHRPPFMRPVPPPRAFRPYAAWPSFSTVLGLRFGSSFSIAINALTTSGYTVSSTYGNTVYLSDVPMLNVIWPEATLYYSNSGRLNGSQFVSRRPYYDRSLFDRVYADLNRTYGSPYDISNNSANGELTVSWWGPGGQFIRLSYGAENQYDYQTNYYTTLNFGIY